MVIMFIFSLLCQLFRYSFNVCIKLLYITCRLKKTPYIRNLAHWKKMSKKDQDNILKTAKDIIKKITK